MIIIKVAFYTLGCKVNTYETEVIINDFKKKGYEIVPFNEFADVYVINTCSVTNTSDQKSRKIIRSASKNNSNAIIIALGCFTQVKGNTIKDIDNLDIILGNKYKNKVEEILREYLKDKKQIIRIDSLKNEKFENMNLDKFENHTRAFVKVQDGCNNYCSFCIIPYTRGNIRSKKKEDVIDEITKLTDNGYKEIVLTGIHTGHYGKDLDDYDFSDLLHDLAKIDKLERIRISSVEIVELDDKFLKELKDNKKIVDHIHIPLQSGCDKILKKMNRRYNMDEFINKIEEIRKIRPDLAITTDVIVGFPGETEEDFNETLNNIKKIGFTELHVFPYSKREGTPAAKMKDQIDGNVKKERVRKLIEESEKLKKEYYSKFIGKELDVLFETFENNILTGHLSNYGKVVVESNKDLRNEIKKVKLISYDNDSFTGKII